MGHDRIGFERPLSFVISSIPSYGNIIDPSTMEVLNAGDSTAGQSIAPYTQGVELIYQPMANLSLRRTLRWNQRRATAVQLDHFSYYAAISDDLLIRAEETTEDIQLNTADDSTETPTPTPAPRKLQLPPLLPSPACHFVHMKIALLEQ